MAASGSSTPPQIVGPDAFSVQWTVGFDSSRHAKYYFNIMTGESRWELPNAAVVKEVDTGLCTMLETADPDAAQDSQSGRWRQCQCHTTGDLYYVHAETLAAQWERPAHGQVEELDWTFTRMVLQLSNEAKFGILSVASVGLLAGGFFHGYWKEQKKIRRRVVPPMPAAAGATASTAVAGSVAVAGPGKHRVRRRLRSQAVNPRRAAAAQAMRALGIATAGSLVTFGGVILLTATALQVSSAKEFGDRMRGTVPAVKERIGAFVEPVARSLREDLRDLRLSKAARELQQQAPAPEEEDDDDEPEQKP